MSEHIPPHILEQYTERKISARQALSIKQHLRGCPNCFRLFNDLYEQHNGFTLSIRDLQLFPVNSVAEGHVQGERLVAFFSGTMNDFHREMVELHLDVCAECSGKVAEIRSYIDTPVDERVVATSTPQSSTSRAAMRERLASFLLAPGQSISASVGYTLAAIAAVILATLAWFAISDRAPNRANVAVNQTPPLTRDAKVASPAPSITPTPSSTTIDSRRPSATNEQATLNKQGLAHSNTRKKRTPASSTVMNPVPDSDNGDAKGDRDENDELRLATSITRAPVLDIFQQSAAVFRGLSSTGEEFSPRAPVSTLVKSVRPTLSWSALAGATSYGVSVFDADLNLVDASGLITATQWAVRKRLKPGEVYTWMVVAIKDGREYYAPAPPSRARFKVIDEPTLTQLKRRIEASKTPAARAVIYAEAGMLDDAERELGSHLDLNPADERARKLLQTIRSWRTGR